MKKLCTFITAMLFIFNLSFAQTVLFEDDFESYTVGSFIAQSSPTWLTWSGGVGTAEDVKVVDTQANSGTKSIHFETNNRDIILPLGNKTSGTYKVEFNILLAQPSGGYFNIQHFQAPGIEWAYEVYFENSGSGKLVANGVDYPFTHAVGEWILVENEFDLDGDEAKLYIDGTLIHTWAFSTLANGGAGTLQLGGVNFYTGAGRRFFIDDVVYTEVVAGSNPPSIDVSTTEINTDGTSATSFTFTNEGDVEMNYIVYPIFPSSGLKSETEATRNLLTHVQSALTGGIGYQNDISNLRIGAKFNPAKVSPFIGMELISVTIGINDMPSNTSLQIYERGDYITPGPGNLIVEKAFTAIPASENTIQLDEPLYLDGKDLWIGYKCNVVGGAFSIGIDDGPHVPGGNWMSSGPGWFEFNNPAIPSNFYIIGELQGNPLIQWLTVSPTSGTLSAGNSETVSVSFNTAGLIDGNYFAQIVIGCNDPAQEYSEVDVNLTVLTNINNVNSKIGIMTYPNPVTNYLNVSSTNNIDLINIYNIKGQLVNSITVNSDNAKVDMTNLNSGNYIFEIFSEGNKVTRNIVVE